MFLKIKNVKAMSGRWVKSHTPLAYVNVSDYQFNELKKLEEKGQPLKVWSLTPYIGIIDNKPQKLGCTLIFSEYSVVDKERVESLLETLNDSNLTINCKGSIAFLNYSKVCFKINGKKLTYDEFCQYQLPKGQVFHEVFDNGYSYCGSEPLRVTSKKYAEIAIGVAKKLNHVWFGWTYGFRCDDDFCIYVPYGKDERYSEVSDT